LLLRLYIIICIDPMKTAHKEYAERAVIRICHLSFLKST